MTFSGYYDHTSPLFNNLWLLKLNNIRIYVTIICSYTVYTSFFKKENQFLLDTIIMPIKLVQIICLCYNSPT